MIWCSQDDCDRDTQASFESCDAGWLSIPIMLYHPIVCVCVCVCTICVYVCVEHVKQGLLAFAGDLPFQAVRIHTNTTFRARHSVFYVFYFYVRCTKRLSFCNSFYVVFCALFRTDFSLWQVSADPSATQVQ